MNLKPWMAWLLALFALAAGPSAAGAAEQKFDAPSGVTLLAQGGGRYLLLWDPIYREDLQGYSVCGCANRGTRNFMRHEHPGEGGQRARRRSP